MNTYQSGTIVTVVMPLVDSSNNPVVPLSVSFRVLDELDAVLIAQTFLTVALGDTGISVQIPAEFNTLSPPSINTNDGANSGNPVISLTGLREVEMTMITTTGSIISKAQYIIKNFATSLVLLQNSFQTFNLAILTSSNMPNIDGWNAAADNDLGYFVRWPRDPDAQNYLNWYNSRNEIIVPRLWQVMTTQRWYAYYPEAFRQAMRSAQVAEADQILQGDIIAKKRKEGLFSEKIGESSVMFRAGKPLDMGISREALEYISGYVDMKLTITRH